MQSHPSELSFGYPSRPDLGPYPPSIIGQNLWHLMHQRDVTIAQLANAMELSEDITFDIIHGPERQFVPEMYEKLAEAFITSPEMMQQDGSFQPNSLAGSSLPAAGWYPDPGGQNQERW